MMNCIKATAIAFALIATASVLPASAEYQGTAAQRAACRPDVFRLCAGDIPNVRAITACLRRNQSRLSEGCAAVFAGELR
jgi:hypothetical protein